MTAARPHPTNNPDVAGAGRLATLLLLGAGVLLAMGFGPFRMPAAHAAVGPVIAVSDATPLPVTEGNSGTTAVSFNITLSATPPSDVTVSYATQYGSATAGVDYVYKEATATFLAGASGAALTQAFTVLVNGDTSPEPTENFFVQLYNEVNGTLGDRFGEAQIADDDGAARQLSVSGGSPSPVTEGNSGTTPVTFTLSLSGTPSGDVTVHYATNYGTATAGTDYVYKEGVTTFLAGASGAALNQTVVVQVNGDTTAEGDETFFLQLYDVGGATVSNAFGQAVIQNDDAAVPTISIADDTSAESGGSITLPVTLSASHANTVTVNYSTMPGTYFDTDATPGADFTATSGTLTFPPGAAGTSITQNIVVPIAADGLTEPSEHFWVQIYDPVGGNLAAIRYGKGIISSPPTAAADSFTTVGNTKLAEGVTVTGEPVKSDAGATASTKANDTDPESDPLTVTAGNITSANGGAVTMNADGTFTYVPPANFSGATDTFTYTLSDGQGNSVTGTVTINFTGRVWYVDNALAPAGDGRSTAPFNSLSQVNGAGGAGDKDVAGDVIFLKTGSGNYTGGLPLEDNERLIGQPENLVVGGFTLWTGTGSNPSITNSAGAGVALAQGNTLRRVSVTGTSGAGITGTGVSTVDVGPNISVTNTTGTGFALSGNAGGTITFDASISQNASSGRPVSIQNRTSGTVNMTGAVTGNNTGVLLDTNAATINMTGLVTMSTGANTALTISGPGNANVTVQPASGTSSFATTTANTVDVNNGGSGNVTIDATVTQNNASATSGKAVSIQSHTGGTISFPKTVASTNGGGVSLSSNSGSTMTFSSGSMSLSTLANTGFSATGGGTVNVTGAANTIATTTATALNVDSTTIGAPGMTFRSISVTGNNTSPTNGIVLNGTGAGALTVTGNSAGACGTASTEADCTGGTIQGTGTSGAGILLTNATGPSLTRVNLKNNKGSGLKATGVSGLTLANSLVQGSADAGGQTEAGLFLTNLSGTNSLASSTVKTSFENNILWTATSGAGTLNVTGSTISSAAANDGLHINASATGGPTLNVTGTAFSNNVAAGIGTNFTGSAAGTVNVTTSTFIDNTSAGITFGTQDDADLTFDVHDNGSLASPAFLRPTLNAIQLIAALPSTANSHISGKIRNNFIGDTNVNSGSRDSYGIVVEVNDDADAVVSITGNNIRHTDQGGINVFSRDPNTSDGNPANATSDWTITGNTVGTPDDNTAFPVGVTYGIWVDGRHNTTTCANISGNTSSHSGAGFDFRVRDFNAAVFKLQGYAGAATNAAQVQAFVAGQNGGGTVEAVIGVGAPGFTTGTCRTPA